MSTRQAPLGAVGNLRFTRAGVYAEYLVSGLPFVFLSKGWQNTVAAEHAELWRNLPSGASLSGLTVPVPARNLTRRMLFAHHDLDPATATPDSIPATVSPWSRHCRTWEPAVSGHRPRRRIYWLSIPLDYGLRGQTSTGTWQQMRNAVIGRDKDTELVASRLPRACRADGRHVAERVLRQTGWGRADLVALELLREPRGVAAPAAQPTL